MATSTPWGLSDSSKKYAPGIIYYSTPSHGGFKLSKKKLANMPKPLQALSFPSPGWFEEDAAWAAVAVAYPKFFGDEVKQARETLKRWYPQVYNEIFNGITNQKDAPYAATEANQGPL